MAEDIELSFTRSLHELRKETDLAQLFETKSVPDNIIDSYWERYIPREPITDSIQVLTITADAKPTNVWTNITQVRVNAGFEFVQREGPGHAWEAVTVDMNAAPVSALLNTFWQEVDIRCNQTQLNGAHTRGLVIYHILTKLSLSPTAKSTFLYTEGFSEEQVDPDLYDDTNQAHTYRRFQYCNKVADGEEGGTPKIIHLTGLLHHDLRYLEHPLVSDTNFVFTLTRAKDAALINRGEPLVPKTYDEATNKEKDYSAAQLEKIRKMKGKELAIHLKYFELYLLRQVLKPAIHERMMELLGSSHAKNGLTSEKRMMKWFYNRVQLFSELIPGNTRTFLSQSLFGGYHMAPLILCFFQSQPRVLGDFSLNPTKLELPGGRLENEKPRLSAIKFEVNGINPMRYFTSYQQGAEEVLNYYYLELYRNINAYYTNCDLDITLNEFKERFTLLSFNTCAEGRHYPDTIPLVKSGSCRIEISFSEPTPREPLQTMYWIGVYPTLLGIDADRKVTTSFRTS